jgi:methionyl aminopeptidase
MPITIKNRVEIERMRAAGSVVTLIHQRIQAAIEPGVTTAELDAIARDTLRETGAKSSFLGYSPRNSGLPPFPGHICTSVNEVIVHGFPSNRQLREGDIISVDVGAILNGFHGDSAWTYPVGRISPEAMRLLEVTEAALYEALAMARAGNRLGAVGHAVDEFGSSRGYGVVRGYGGHGIGRQMHEDPHVPNEGDPRRGPMLRSGMTLAIEPMLNAGTAETRVLDDDWTVVTSDGSLSAHFEHTVAITMGDADILTRRPVGVIQ